MSQSRIVVYVDESNEKFVRGLIEGALRSAYGGQRLYNLTVEPVTVDEEKCVYCGEFYPAPVSLHHTEAECKTNREPKASTDAPAKSA